MKYNFCTYFDRNYFYKGLALYYSLLRSCKEFELWILCLDDITYTLLEKMKLLNCRLIRLKEFEDEELLSIKSTRTTIEYYYTCTPSLPLHILKNYPQIDMITYLDADLFFFSDPEPIYCELGDNSILITEHRRSCREKYQTERWGKYCVQFLTFRNDALAMDCLNWWRTKCLEWCYRKSENGKCADQKYLDEWPTMFKKVHVLKHKGGGLALWNIERYKIMKNDKSIFVDDDLLIFYHFHLFEILSQKKFQLSSGYTELSKYIIDTIYLPYIEVIKGTFGMVHEYDQKFKYGFLQYKLGNYKTDTINELFKFIAKKVLGIIIKKYDVIYEG